ncbi:Ubiquinone/menaquinone biosynthesis C-methyltransferase UbiE [Candidatus Burarchaeum australiense]|nr:Ubiquinone/menaquinone biosynthesis C-methyltransferase UbiE [Candidatus Burarchaeum australiense]
MAMPRELGRRCLEHFKTGFPELYGKCIRNGIEKQPTENLEFTLDGRGLQYLNSVFRYPLARKEGATALFKLLGNMRNLVILDAFGGNGYLTRISKEIGTGAKIITNDISSFMVLCSMELGNPTTWQSADDLFLMKDGCSDAVVMAYGTHHLPVARRLPALQEAYRVLKKGGKLLLHDFENDSSMARFFREVVERYSVTGHNHAHFDREKTLLLFRNAGFRETSVTTLHDDFVFRNGSEKESLADLLEYFYLMYGLEKLGDMRAQKTKDKLYALINEYLGTKCSRSGKEWECRASREAVVFIGEK